MARTVGTVKSISGKAAVKTLNDQLHVLNVGEALHENEMVYALGTDSKVTLTLEGGRELTLNGNDEILLDKSVFSVLDEGEALDVKALQQALAETLNPENLEETAAGQEVVGDANAGAEFADRNDARGDPSSYLTGTESSPLAVTLEPDNPQTQNTAPDATDDSYDPEAENDALSTPEDSSLTILPATLLSNDSDIDGNTLSIIGVQDATNGTVALVDGNIVFTPNTNYNGPASFTYTISDGQGGSDTATVNINVTPVNDTPTIEVTANDFTEDSGVLAGATAGTYVTSDEDTGDTLTVTFNTPSTHYILEDGVVKLTQAGVDVINLGGTLDTIDLKVTDTDGAFDIDSDTPVVTPTNDAPIAVNDTGNTDVITYTSAWNYDLNAGNDYSNDNVTITALGGEGFLVDGSGPTMGVDGLSNDSGQQIDPGEGLQFVFDQDIKLLLIDLGNFNSTQDTVTLILKDGDTIIDSSDYTVTFNILQNGHYGDILTINSDVAFDTIQVLNDETNDKSFSIDQLLASNSGTTTLTEGSLLYFSEADLLSNDTDPDGDTLNIISVDDSLTLGSVTMDSNGNILYDPTDAYDTIIAPAIDTFSYTISDGNGGTSTAVVTVTLLPSAGTTFLGDVLLIDGEQTIDLSNISALLSDTNSTINQIDMKNGDTTILNVSPDHVDTISDGTLYVNGDAGDTIDLSGSWSLATDQLTGYDSYSGSVNGNDVFLHVDEEVTIIP
ncbi:MAG: hypothetical protein A3I60_01685 [Sulfuricurvum sp. RIFCSPLOWO2_02_FULL_43_45]|nr:MAG: hypothetical protein A3I60_01685 [Sulfuricurvum sp. RIFCSPLOWO2_02_FULL_43_45]